MGWFVLATDLPALTVVFWRCALGALAMALVCAAQGLLRRGMLARRQLYWIMLGGVILTLNWVCLFIAYVKTSIAVATITYHVRPFILVVLGAVLFNETLARYKLGWMVIAFSGVALIMLGGQQQDQDSGQYVYGVGFALAAAFFTPSQQQLPRHCAMCLLA
ncbi:MULTISPECIES: EamA family transporter [Symbiopectobacterium]|uniref:EamA family transporter n=1 Tax=Symbiopectobacterium TaxID=801 RepID=UPI00207AEBBC|nr:MULTISPECIES: EamA family transporter [Symbiopectobacterium]